MKILLRCFLIIVPFITSAQTNCLVSVKIGGVTKAGKAIVKLGTQIDSVNFANNMFEFNKNANGNLAKINIIYSQTTTARNTHAFYIYLVPGHIDIHVSPPDSVFKIILTGPPITVDYQEKLRKPVDSYNSEINKIKLDYLTEIKKQHPDSLLLSKLSVQLKATVKKCFAVPQAYINDHPDSPLSLIALGMMGNGAKDTPVTVADLSRLFNSLTDNIKSSPEGLQYSKKLAYLQFGQK